MPVCSCSLALRRRPAREVFLMFTLCSLGSNVGIQRFNHVDTIRSERKKKKSSSSSSSSGSNSSSSS